MFPKTIFITSFFGLIARNILSTDILDILRSRKDLRIVIFVPKEKEILYRDTFAGGNVIVEGVLPDGTSIRKEIPVQLSVFAADRALVPAALGSVGMIMIGLVGLLFFRVYRRTGA